MPGCQRQQLTTTTIVLCCATVVCVLIAGAWWFLASKDTASNSAESILLTHVDAAPKPDTAVADRVVAPVPTRAAETATVTLEKPAPRQHRHALMAVVLPPMVPPAAPRMMP